MLVEEVYHADAQGTILSLVDENAVIKTRYKYTVYGAPTVVGEASGNPYMYTGREYDFETGLYFFRNRYQSPILGRFTSEDPLGVEAGLNFYAYVGGDPVNFTDPWGLFSVGVGGSYGGFDVSSDVYDSDKGLWPSAKPDVGVSTTLIGGGISICWDDSKDICSAVHPNEENVTASVGISKYLGYSSTLAGGTKCINIGVGAGLPISFNTPVQNFGDWLRKLFN